MAEFGTVHSIDSWVDLGQVVHSSKLVQARGFSKVGATWAGGAQSVLKSEAYTGIHPLVHASGSTQLPHVPWTLQAPLDLLDKSKVRVASLQGALQKGLPLLCTPTMARLTEDFAKGMNMLHCDPHCFQIPERPITLRVHACVHTCTCM
jgi:hypothetical protein